MEINCEVILYQTSDDPELKKKENEKVKLLAIAYYNYGTEEEHFDNFKKSMIWFKKSYEICSKYKHIDKSFKLRARNSYLDCKKVKRPL